MGYYVDERRACTDAREAQQRGIGWHASTDRYVDLPWWFGSYMQALPECVGASSWATPVLTPLH